VVDQAALHGVLKKMRDVGMPLLSVNRVKPGQADASDVKQGSEASCLDWFSGLLMNNGYQIKEIVNGSLNF
jgi:hypothetical protein